MQIVYLAHLREGGRAPVRVPLKADEVARK